MSKQLTRAWAVKWFHGWRLHAEGARTTKAESKDAAPGETLMVKNPPLNTTAETAQIDVAVEHGRDSRWCDVAAENGRDKPRFDVPANVPPDVPADHGRESRRHDMPDGHGRDSRRFFGHADHSRDSRKGGASASKLTWRPKLHAAAEQFFFG